MLPGAPVEHFPIRHNHTFFQSPKSNCGNCGNFHNFPLFQNRIVEMGTVEIYIFQKPYFLVVFDVFVRCCDHVGLDCAPMWLPELTLRPRKHRETGFSLMNVLSNGRDISEVKLPLHGARFWAASIATRIRFSGICRAMS